jgi:hypothetical protein
VLAAGGAPALLGVLLPTARAVHSAALTALALLAACADPAGSQVLIDAGARVALRRYDPPFHPFSSP